MKITEVFKSVQGEGKYAGYPMTFIRLSGCTRKCSFCDTKYHIKGKIYSTKIVVQKLIKLLPDKTQEYHICWTGGEPLLQLIEIAEVIEELEKIGYKLFHHLETNGDILVKIYEQRGRENYENRKRLGKFYYIACSPKEKEIARIVSHDSLADDIKVVTDLQETGTDMLKYATEVMPLTMYDLDQDDYIQKKVWQYCAENNKRYCARLHYLIFKDQKGV